MSRRPLPDSVKRAIARQRPDDAWRIGAGPRPASTIKPAAQPADDSPAPVAGKRRAKFGNEKTTDAETGEVFDSKLEHRVWRALVSCYGSRSVVRQLSIPVGGGVRMRPDFAVFSPVDWSDPSNPRPRVLLALIDAKGPEPTQDWKNKAKLLYSVAGLTIFVARNEHEAITIVETAKARIEAANPAPKESQK